jgi:hypothetical protein
MKTLLANPYARFRSLGRQRGHRLGVKLGEDKALRKRNLSGSSLRVEKSTLPEGFGLSRAFRELFAPDRVDPLLNLPPMRKTLGGWEQSPLSLHNQQPHQNNRISSLVASSNSDIHAEPVHNQAIRLSHILSDRSQPREVMTKTGPVEGAVIKPLHELGKLFAPCLVTLAVLVERRRADTELPRNEGYQGYWWHTSSAPSTLPG